MTVAENRWSKEARDTMANSSAGEPTVNASMDMRRRPGRLTSRRWAMSQPTPMTTQMVEMPAQRACHVASLTRLHPYQTAGCQPDAHGCHAPRSPESVPGGVPRTRTPAHRG
jgi:hypothetical protein